MSVGAEPQIEMVVGFCLTMVWQYYLPRGGAELWRHFVPLSSDMTWQLFWSMVSNGGRWLPLTARALQQIQLRRFLDVHRRRASVDWRFLMKILQPCTPVSRHTPQKQFTTGSLGL
jgi:hypothetical protein